MKRIILCATIVAAALAAQTGKSHTLRGKVTQVDAAGKRLMIVNEAVEGWMGPMTMGYAVSNPAILDVLHAGDQITATVYDGDTSHLYEVALAAPLPSVSAPSSLRLQDFESMALAGHPAIIQAEAMRKAAAGLARQAGLYPNPTVGYYSDEVRGGYSGGGKQGAFLSQTILLGGKLSAASRVGRLDVERASVSAEVQRARVLADVRASFYSVLAAQRLVDVRHRLALVAADAAETSRQLANTGQADRPDVLTAEIERQQAELNSRDAEQYLEGVWGVLAAFAGKPDLPVSRVEGDFDALADLTLQERLSSVLGQSPEIQLAQSMIARAEAALFLSTKVPIPDITVAANLSQNFQPLEGTARQAGLQGGVQVGIQIPLFNRNQGNVAAARAEIEVARADVDRQKLRLDRAVRALYSDYARARRIVLINRSELLPRAEEALRLYQSNYQKMAGPWPAALMAQRTLFQLEIDLVRALDSAWQNAISLQNFGLNAAQSPIPY